MSHALFSPSSAHRWLTCPGSIKLSEGEKDTGGAAAAEGTFLHECMQKHLQDGVPLTEFALTEEQLSILSECARHVSSINRMFAAYEIKVEFGTGICQPNEESFGTADVVLVTKYGRDTVCRIIDYKFGRNRVDPMFNTQGCLYMLGIKAYMDSLGFDIDVFEFEILQPRSAGKLSNGVFSMTPIDLEEWAADAAEKCRDVKDAIKQKGKIADTQWTRLYLAPSESGCDYCRAAYKCPALKALMDEAEPTGRKSDSELADMFDNLDGDDLAERLAKVPMLKRYIEALEAEGMNRALNGDVPDGFKLIEGRQGNRKWTDKDMVAAKFVSMGIAEVDFTEISMKSPAQMEKQLVTAGNTREKAREIIAELVDRSPPKPSLVPVHHAGKDWFPVIVDDQFEPIN